MWSRLWSRLDRGEHWAALARQANNRPRSPAAPFGVSLRQLEHYYTAAFRQHLNERLRAIRMRSVQRVVSDGLSANATDYEVGFKKPSHFSREFKRQTADSPVGFGSQRIRPSGMSPLDK